MSRYTLWEVCKRAFRINAIAKSDSADELAPCVGETDERHLVLVDNEEKAVIEGRTRH